MSTKKNTAANAAVNSCTPATAVRTVAAINLTRGMILADGDWLIYRQPDADDRGRMIVDVEKGGARQRLRLAPGRRVPIATTDSGA